MRVGSWVRRLWKSITRRQVSGQAFPGDAGQCQGLGPALLALGLVRPPETGAYPIHISHTAPHSTLKPHSHTSPAPPVQRAHSSQCPKCSPPPFTKPSTGLISGDPRCPPFPFGPHFPRLGGEGAPKPKAAENQGEGWAEESRGPSPCQLPHRCPINHSVAVQLGILGAPCHTQPAEQWDYFRGGEDALGRGSGGGASFPQPVPRHPTSACGGQGRVAERTRVARGWQGLAGLIQLAGSLPPPCDSRPAGAQPRAAALCVQNPCIWIQSLPLGHPHPTSGTCGSPPPPLPSRPWPPQKSWETVAGTVCA